jgi:hypothetical protein
LNGDAFLLRESKVVDDMILIFSTKFELEKLIRANFWIMDGTFKTVPNIFLQIYKIHAPVGGIISRILSLVYVLMSSRNEQLFEDLIDICDSYGFELNPKCIITYFKKAAINAVSNIFPQCIQKGYFFYLGKNVWRKIQSIGLAIQYGSDEDFSVKLRNIPVLTLLPPGEFKQVFKIIKNDLPTEILYGLMKYI